MKSPEQILVGFALETNNEEENAIYKLRKKNLDLIVLNSLQDKGAGFKKDTNKITIFNRAEEKVTYELKPKAQVAQDICTAILKLYKA
jgi:phosphopantothenoylcysteine decarboxylase/phosphopantothenate--cysteine ligase